jgi:hypothetical protein
MNQADEGSATDAFVGIQRGGEGDMTIEPIRDDKGNIVDTQITRINPAKIVEKYNQASPSEVARRKAGIGSPASQCALDGACPPSLFHLVTGAGW